MRRRDVEADPVLRQLVAEADARADHRPASRAHMLDVIGPKDGHPWSCICDTCAARRESPTATSSPRTCSPHTGKGAKKGPSALERRFMGWLNAEMVRGNVIRWAYEPIRVVLPAVRATTKRDFLVRVAPSVPVESFWWPFRADLVLLELKPTGKDAKPYWTRVAKLRTKLSATVLAGLITVAGVWRREGGWAADVIEPREVQ